MQLQGVGARPPVNKGGSMGARKGRSGRLHVDLSKERSAVTHIWRVAVDGFAPHGLAVVADAQGADTWSRHVEQAVLDDVALEVDAVLLDAVCGTKQPIDLSTDTHKCTAAGRQRLLQLATHLPTLRQQQRSAPTASSRSTHRRHMVQSCLCAPGAARHQLLTRRPTSAASSQAASQR